MENEEKLASRKGAQEREGSDIMEFDIMAFER